MSAAADAITMDEARRLRLIARYLSATYGSQAQAVVEVALLGLVIDYVAAQAAAIDRLADPPTSEGR